MSGSSMVDELHLSDVQLLEDLGMLDVLLFVELMIGSPKRSVQDGCC
jgi:hypothetical protein